MVEWWAVRWGWTIVGIGEGGLSTGGGSIRRTGGGSYDATYELRFSKQEKPTIENLPLVAEYRPLIFRCSCSLHHKFRDGWIPAGSRVRITGSRAGGFRLPPSWNMADF